MKNRLALVPLLAALSTACTEKGNSTHSDPPAHSMVLEVEVAPNTEAWVCWVGPMPNGAEPMAVRKIESWQTPGMHHMDLASIDFVAGGIAPGTYDCNDLYADVPTLMEDMMTLYGAQEEHQVFDLPDGVAAVIPGGTDVLYEIHFVNASTEPVVASARIDVWTMPMGKVEERIWGTVNRDEDIVVDPMTRTTEWNRCTLTDTVDVIAMSSHMHQRGVEANVRRFDGVTSEPAPLYVNTQWDRPLIQTFLEDPIKVSAGAGFEYRCIYENRTDEPVTWGFTAEDEMCSMTLVFMPGDIDIACTAVDSGRIVEPL